MGNSTSKSDTYRAYYESLTKNPAAIQQIDLNKVDPYEVLGVGKQFTWDELKDAYKRVAKLVHPDKGGNEQLFNTVTTCFKKLAHELKMKEVDKPHHVLKAASQAASQASQAYSDTRDRGLVPPPIVNQKDGNDFSSKFNQFFDEYKIDDADTMHHGYGHMMTPSSKNREDIKIDKKLTKFTNNAFNKAFEKQAPLSKDVIIYKEPEPLVLAKNIQYTELGVDKVDDFTHVEDPAQRRGGGLQYTDYMRAYTTSRLVDPRAIEKRKEFKNVEEYEMSRASRTQELMTSEEKEYQEKSKRKQEQAEEDRLYRIKERDNTVSKKAEEVTRKRVQYF